LKTQDVVRGYPSLCKADSVFAGDDIPWEKLNNAASTHGEDTLVDEVFLLIDTTPFGSPEDGLLLTSKRLYVREVNEQPRAIPPNETRS
jgi:hypothetical protein